MYESPWSYKFVIYFVHIILWKIFLTVYSLILCYLLTKCVCVCVWSVIKMIFILIQLTCELMMKNVCLKIEKINSVCLCQALLSRANLVISRGHEHWWTHFYILNIITSFFLHLNKFEKKKKWQFASFCSVYKLLVSMCVCLCL